MRRVLALPKNKGVSTRTAPPPGGTGPGSACRGSFPYLGAHYGRALSPAQPETSTRKTIRFKSGIMLVICDWDRFGAPSRRFRAQISRSETESASSRHRPSVTARRRCWLTVRGAGGSISVSSQSGLDVKVRPELIGWVSEAPCLECHGSAHATTTEPQGNTSQHTKQHNTVTSQHTKQHNTVTSQHTKQHHSVTTQHKPTQLSTQANTTRHAPPPRFADGASSQHTIQHISAANQPFSVTCQHKPTQLSTVSARATTAHTSQHSAARATKALRRRRLASSATRPARTRASAGPAGPSARQTGTAPSAAATAAGRPGRRASAAASSAAGRCWTGRRGGRRPASCGSGRSRG